MRRWRGRATTTVVALLWLLLVAAAPVHGQDAPPAVTDEPSQAPETPRAQIDMGALGNTVRTAIGEALGQ